MANERRTDLGQGGHLATHSRGPGWAAGLQSRYCSTRRIKNRSAEMRLVRKALYPVDVVSKVLQRAMPRHRIPEARGGNKSVSNTDCLAG